MEAAALCRTKWPGIPASVSLLEPRTWNPDTVARPATDFHMSNDAKSGTTVHLLNDLPKDHLRSNESNVSIVLQQDIVDKSDKVRRNMTKDLNISQLSIQVRFTVI